MKKAILSVILGIISLFPGMIFICGGMWIEGCMKFEYILEDYFFIFYPLTIICGIAGLIMGIKSFKLYKIAILGIILSVLGLLTALLILAFGLWTATWQ